MIEVAPIPINIEIPIPIGPENGELTTEEFVGADFRGQCGGVKMALAGGRQALEIADGAFPIYTPWRIVHNDPVMQELEAQGLIVFNNDWTRVPNGGVVFYPAHGKPRSVDQIASEKDLLTIDLTCQLVDRVHNLAIRAEKAGKHVLYAGVNGHPETEGVRGEIQPDNFTLIQNLEDAMGTQLPSDRKAILLSQTTLSTAELKEIFEFFSTNPQVEIPKRWDICPATDRNQEGVDTLIKIFGVDFLLVQGSKGSHNTDMLRQKAINVGIPSAKIDTSADIRREWFTGGVTRVGFTSGASVEDKFEEPVIDWFRKEGIAVYDLSKGVKKEKQFTLPESDLAKLRERREMLHG